MRFIRRNDENSMSIKLNPSLIGILLLGGVAVGVGLYLWSKKKAAAPVVPESTPPTASATDLAPPSDGGVIDVQGLGYYSTNRRQRVRTLPNR